MRYLCFVKMDESQANPPKALMEAMGEHVGQGVATGMLVDAGGLYGAKDAVEYRVRGGNLTVTDGPYAEAKEHLGSFTIVDCESLERALEIAALNPAARYVGVEVRPLMHEADMDV